MKKYEKNCYIALKGGLLKSYNFSEEFINKNEQLFNELENIWDEIYSFDCCIFGAIKTNKNNDDLKMRLCNTLDKMYDLNIEIYNDWDNKTYKNKNDYRKYILEYEKEVVKNDK